MLTEPLQSVRIPVVYSACGNRGYPGNFQNKLVSSSYKLVPKHILFLAKLKGKGRPFLNGKACIDISFELSLTCGVNV